LNIRGRFNRKMFAHNTHALGVDNLRANLLIRHIWQVPFYLDNFIEDNDTEDEDSSDHLSDS